MLDAKFKHTRKACQEVFWVVLEIQNSSPRAKFEYFFGQISAFAYFDIMSNFEVKQTIYIYFKVLSVNVITGV